MTELNYDEMEALVINLPREDQLRLMEKIAQNVRRNIDEESKNSIRDLEGLDKELTKEP